MFAQSDKSDKNTDTRFISYTVNVAKQSLKFYWKNDSNQHFGSIRNLQTWLQRRNEKLVFAMNGGMYKTDHSPLGLYVENGKIISRLNTLHGEGNFHLPPNGVFYITNDNKAVICETKKFANNGNIKYATQSGPLLIVNGQMNPLCKKGSVNVNIRNGVGILPDGKAIFAMSKTEVNFYDFADYFKRMGCKNALYLDGFVSRMYLPEQRWAQLDGDFGVMIGVTTSSK